VTRKVQVRRELCEKIDKRREREIEIEREKDREIVLIERVRMKECHK
jgi:hypothetical protein